MKLEIADAPAEKTQRIYARLAGSLFLWLIINGLAGTLILSHIAGSEPSQKQQRESQRRNAYTEWHSPVG